MTTSSFLVSQLVTYLFCTLFLSSFQIHSIDNQVKLRGHRVELGEIEAILLRHECVKEAVVVLSPNGQVFEYFWFAIE